MKQKTAPQLKEGDSVEVMLSQQFLYTSAMSQIYGTKWADGKIYGFNKLHDEDFARIHVLVNGVVHYNLDPEDVLAPLTEKEKARYAKRE